MNNLRCFFYFKLYFTVTKAIYCLTMKVKMYFPLSNSVFTNVSFCIGIEYTSYIKFHFSTPKSSSKCLFNRKTYFEKLSSPNAYFFLNGLSDTEYSIVQYNIMVGIHCKPPKLISDKCGYTRHNEITKAEPNPIAYMKKAFFV